MDTFNLERFVAAQEQHGTWQRALSELQAGQKRTHWMWFVFPQLAGLGSSPTAQHFAISSLDEARAYAAHPQLGARLRAAAAALRDHAGTSAQQIFGDVDAMKLRSSLTLFAQACPHEPMFAGTLGQFFESPDPRTLQLLAGA